MKFNFFSLSTILKKFLFFNLIIFVFLGIWTFLYFSAIKPNLIENRSNQHVRIINNITDHINRLNIKFTKENVTGFLVLGIFTFLYLNAIKPNLVKNRSNQHTKIIKNTSEHINRLNVE